MAHALTGRGDDRRSARPGAPVRGSAITLGDPRGIGPEIVAAALADPAVRDVAAYPSSVRAERRRPPTSAIGRVDRPAGSAADAGARLAGRAIERAVELAHARRGRRHRHRADRQARAARRRLRLSRAHRDARRAHRPRRRDDARRHATDAGMPNPLRVVLATTHIAAARRARMQLTRETIVAAARGHARGPARLVRHRRAAHRALRAQSARRRRRALRPRGRRAARARGARGAASPVRFPPTRSSCARCAASSTPSSRRITTSA